MYEKVVNVKYYKNAESEDFGWKLKFPNTAIPKKNLFVYKIIDFYLPWLFRFIYNYYYSFVKYGNYINPT